MKKIISILMAALLICTMLPLASIVSFAEVDTTVYEGNYSPANGYYIIRSAAANNLCLGIAGNSKDSGGNLELQPVESSKANIFRIEKSNEVEAYIITAYHSRKVLEIEGGYADAKTGTNIDQRVDYEYWGQRWIFFDAGDGKVNIRSYIHKTLLWMDVKGTVQAGANVYVDAKKDVSSQKWKLEKTDAPYQISTPEQLNEIAELVAGGCGFEGETFKLTKDITYKGPKIGGEKNPFRGVFDGNGHTLDVQIPGEIVSYKKTAEGEEKTVVKIPSSSYTGLFSSLDGATVKNLKIKGTVSSTGEGEGFVGAVAGYAYNKTVIDNCFVTAAVTGTDGNIGGIAGAMSASTISNCTMEGNVTNNGLVGTGGIVGSLLGSGVIQNCTYNGKVTGDVVVGGIVGGIVGVGEMVDLESAVMVAKDKGDKVVASIVSGKTIIENCSSLGSTAENKTGVGSGHGGIVGLINGYVESVSINNCISKCEIGVSKESGYIIGNYQDICQTWTLKDISYIPKTFTGDGTKANPCQISDADQLAQIAEYVVNGSDYGGKYFKLTKDITYKGPKIGDEKHPFRGVFDGDGHTLDVNITSGSYTGLFASLDGAVVRNLKIKGTVSGTGEGACAVGAVAGNAYGETLIDNCYVTADVTGTDGNIGGIAGAMSESTISNCRMDGNVKNTGRTSTGGILGGILGGGNIYNCMHKGKITADKAVGGILGCVMGGKTIIGNCSSAGSTAENTTGGGYEHGGIVGFIDSGVESFDIINCFSQCAVGVSKDSGYIIGNNQGAGQISAEFIFYIVKGEPENVLGTGNKINNAIIKTARSINDTTAERTLNQNVKTYNDKGYAFSKWGKNNSGLFPISCAFGDNYIASYASVFGEMNPITIIVVAAILVVAIIIVAVLILLKKRRKN